MGNSRLVPAPGRKARSGSAGDHQGPGCGDAGDSGPSPNLQDDHLHIVEHFWSVILYDSQTRSMLQTDQDWPAVSSQTKGLLVNADGSVDVYFGPQAPAGKENNWIQTIPGKGWNTLLRLYGPLEPFYHKTWRPGEIELQQRGESKRQR